MEELELLKEADDNLIIDNLKNYILDIDDLKKIEKFTKIKVDNDNYLEYKKLVDNINLVYEVFKYSKNVEGKINLLEVIYKFEGIFHSDITTLVINIKHKFYTNIHIYVPVSKETYHKVKDDLQEIIQKIKENSKHEVIDYSASGLQISEANFIKNDRIAGKLTVPIYVKKKKIGQLLFYYLDYRLVRSRE
ncbi:MAG: hypothetical protein KKH98_09670 [Spirochaetes bacterium]|nr:hypothetical protein [Spirochaetota bacterium]